MSERARALDAAAAHARRFLESLDERPVAARGDAEAVRAALGGPLSARGEDPEAVDRRARRGRRSRHRGDGGAALLRLRDRRRRSPAALAADWLGGGLGPVRRVPLALAGRGGDRGDRRRLGARPARPPRDGERRVRHRRADGRLTCLAAARHAVLARPGWDVERDGLAGAPPVHVVCGEQAHVTVFAALRLLGLGRGATRVAVDAQGRIDADALAAALAELDGPTIVCAQAGEVAPGPSIPSTRSPTRATRHGAWLHVDGAFGLWAAARADAALVRGVERADSWGDRRPQVAQRPLRRRARDRAPTRRAHQVAMSLVAAYLVADDAQREPTKFVPESSRRARAVPVYAALRALGRDGVAELIERNCAQARRMAAALAQVPGARRSSTTSCSTRCSCASPAATRPTRRSWPPSSATAHAGSAGRSGTGRR